MNTEVYIGTSVEKKRKGCWPAKLAMTLGPPLALLLLERYGFLFLDLNGDEEFIRAAPAIAREQ